MKTVAIIPVKGRECVLFYTVKRLVDDGLGVVCVGHTMSEKVVCEMAGGEFILIKDNIPIAAKWQMALDRARTYDPSSILYMGSGDWISHNWVKTLQQDLDNGYAMSGTKGIYFLDIQPKNEKKLIWWGGYMEDRGNEPIGTGRLFSREILDIIDWRLFNITLNSSIDYCQMEALWAVKEMWPEGKLVHFNSSKDIASLSTSTYRWPNKHDFKGECKYPTARVISAPDSVLSKYFKEAVNLFNE